MRVLILGGTGTMGRYLTDLLAHDENELIITSRSDHCPMDNIHYEKGNAHDVDFLQKVFSKHGLFDAVIDFMIYKPAEFEEHVTLLLENTKQYFFLSSARVYADSDSALKEDSLRLLDIVNDEKFIKSDKYAIAKAREENILRKQNKHNWTIIRPYITYGNYRLQLGVYEKEDWLYRALNGRSIVFSKDLAGKYTTMTFAGDVAMGISRLIGKENAFGQVFHIAIEAPILWDDVLSVYRKQLEKHGYAVSVIYADKAEEVINRSEQVKYDRIYDRCFDSSKIAEVIDISDFTDPRTGLALCLEHFLNDPAFKRINWVTQARMGRFAKEKTPLKNISTIKNKTIYFILRYLIDYTLLKPLISSFK